MDEEGPFFAGPNPMLVDFVMGPWALRNWVFDHFKGGLGTPADPGGSWVRWQRWVKAIETRSSMRGTTSEKEHYLAIYQR